MFIVIVSSCSKVEPCVGTKHPSWKGTVAHPQIESSNDDTKAVGSAGPMKPSHVETLWTAAEAWGFAERPGPSITSMRSFLSHLYPKQKRPAVDIGSNLLFSTGYHQRPNVLIMSHWWDSENFACYIQMHAKVATGLDHPFSHLRAPPFARSLAGRPPWEPWASQVSKLCSFIHQSTELSFPTPLWENWFGMLTTRQSYMCPWWKAGTEPGRYSYVVVKLVFPGPIQGTSCG